MARVVLCPKCGKKGSLQPKKTKHGIYWRIGHYIGLKGKTRQVKWCYIGKELPESIKKQMITQKEQVITQEFTQTTQNSAESKNLNLRSSYQIESENRRAGRLAWLGHLLDVQKVAGSNPARPTFLD